MKLLMAVSSDGFLASGPDDRMQWTGVTDKAIFRLLTLTGGGNVFAGRKTAENMPSLKGRTVHVLSKGGLSLADAAHSGAWLIGGPTVAAAALEAGYITQAVLCRVPATLYKGVSVDVVTRRLPDRPDHTIHLGDVEVMIFTPITGGRG